MIYQILKIFVLRAFNLGLTLINLNYDVRLIHWPIFGTR